MIKTDPSQTKTVIALLVILAGAVGATVLRIHPDSAQRVAANAAASAVTAVKEEPAPCVIVAAGPAARNPFRKPRAISAALSREAKQRITSDANGVGQGPAGADNENFDLERVGPMPLGDVIETRASASDTANAEQSKPQFVLLATVSGPNGLTAVIRVADSTTRVVGVGDTLDGHYKVAKLEADRAVLKNGSDVIEVRRPS